MDNLVKTFASLFWKLQGYNFPSQISNKKQTYSINTPVRVTNRHLTWVATPLKITSTHFAFWKTANLTSLKTISKIARLLCSRGVWIYYSRNKFRTVFLFQIRNGSLMGISEGVFYRHSVDRIQKALHQQVYSLDSLWQDFISPLDLLSDETASTMI